MSMTILDETLVVQSKYIPVTFTEEKEADDQVPLWTLPAGARLKEITMNDSEFMVEGLAGAISIGNLAATGVAEDLDRFAESTMLTAETLKSVVKANKFAVELPLVLVVTQNSAEWTGKTLHLWVDFVQE